MASRAARPSRSPAAKTPPAAAPATGTRGARTRSSLVRAAREVFERDGFVDARITDITSAAGVATGSFYTHFANKEEVFTAVMAEVQEEMLHPQLREATADDDPIAVIEATNRAYLLAYRRNAKLMALMEQVALVNDDFHRLRLERAEAFARRNAKGIRRLQEQGLADPDLDPLITAHAINGMVSRMANLVFVHRYRMPFEALLQNLTRLWVNALRIPATGADAAKRTSSTKQRRPRG